MGFPAFAHNHPALNTPAVWHPELAEERERYAVALFRRAFELPRRVRELYLWVSASQRFELFLDGKRIARGPSRGDPLRWNCPVLRLEDLRAGPHVLAARVTHFGECAGIGQMGGPAFFLLAVDPRSDAAATASDLLRTGPTWRCWHDASRTPVKHAVWGARRFTYAVGCGDEVDGRTLPWGWEAAGFDDSAWPAAKVVCRGAYCPWGNLPLGHLLRPDPLPQMEETPERFARVAEAPDDLRAAAETWLRGGEPLTIPAGRSVRLVLDRGVVTNAYPELTVSGGSGARVRLVSAEAPYTGEGHAKGNRDETAGKHIWGQRDDFILDGGEQRTYSTLWFRSFRYVELVVETAGEAVRLDGLRPVFTGFPMKMRASFEAGGPRGAAFARMWDVSWRTARLCAHETFFDCPHYEQAQFPGDTRIQAIYHYLVTGDDLLARKAIDDFHASRIAEGLPRCKHPSHTIQMIATYALHWIGMLHDFLMYRRDPGFVHPYLPAAREALEWFARRRRDDGLLGFIEYAPFTDWTPNFECGNAPQDLDGGSSILTLFFARACRWMTDLERVCGYKELTQRWWGRGAELEAAVFERCWDSQRKMLADTPARRSFSQHAQVEAVLGRPWTPHKAYWALGRALKEANVTPIGTLYYRYYLAQALKWSELRQTFFDLLPAWERSLEGTGLTTWPECDANSRSDCHAWSVSPAIEFLETILGVRQAWLGFEDGSILFRPNLGPLPEARGVVPTHGGDVHVRLWRSERGTEAEIETPVPIRVPNELDALPPGRHQVLGDQLPIPALAEHRKGRRARGGKPK